MDQQPKKPNNQYLSKSVQVLGVAVEMGFIIALPIVLLGFGGKWLDGRMHTHFFVYLAIVLAIALSTTWIFKRVAALAKRMQ